VSAAGLAHRLPITRRADPAPLSSRAAVAQHSRGYRRTAKVALVLLMSLTSLALWTAVPAGLLWLAARLEDGGQLSTSSAIMSIAWIPGAIGLGGKALAELNNVYVRITGASVSPYRPPWLRSINDSRPSSPLTALDIILIASVAVATMSLALYIAVNGVPTPLS